MARRVEDEVGVLFADASKIVREFFEVSREGLARDGELVWPGFGRWWISEYEQTVGGNRCFDGSLSPKRKVKARRLLFRPSGDLKLVVMKRGRETGFVPPRK